MSHQPRTEYLKTQVMTASPEALQLMLWDGAIRFAEQGKAAILKKDIEGSYNALLRSQKIIMELNTTLKRSLAPELCSKLASLYNFIYRRLVDANTKKKAEFVDDALEIMRHQRETWVMLMEKLSEARSAKARATALENAEAINTAEEISSAAGAPGAQPLSGAPAAAPKRTLYPSHALKPARPVAASLSIQG